MRTILILAALLALAVPVDAGHCNGIPGAQRGDEVYDDTCDAMIASDTIVL